MVVLLEECVVTSPECRDLLSNEYVVYLKVSIPTQIERMKNGRASALPVADLEGYLQKQHDERDILFEEVATFIVDSKGSSEDDSMIAEIVEKDVKQVLNDLNV